MPGLLICNQFWRSEMTSGSLQILNIGLGDIEFRFESGDPSEVEKARRAIDDMLRRGYTILVDDGTGHGSATH